MKTTQTEPLGVLMFVRAYLRASTVEQDALRAKAELVAFAAERGLPIASFYLENETGASLRRPELFRLLSDCHPGDMLLIEQVDRLSRLDAGDWEQLKAELLARRVRVVALDLPTSWMMLATITDEMTARMLEALNSMMLDMLAAIARKDYTDRRRRQKQGIAKRQAAGGYTGRQENIERNTAIMVMLRRGDSWSMVQAASGCSRSTLARLAQRLRALKQPEAPAD
jgi:DNA invertase Pin-like site-specific DNA recombinase